MSLEIIIAILIFGFIIIAGLLIFLIKRSPDHNTLRIIRAGKQFDNYKIIRPIKRGGMATIYLARDVKMNRQVALKIMHENLVDDEDLITKFLYEGDILERLNRKHPDAPIVRVYRHSRESNDIHGRPFIALEYIDGVDLDELIRKGKRFSLQEILTIICETGKALSAAHKEDVWHRDVSPGNIIISEQIGGTQNIKVVDFGVAKHEYIGKHTPDGSIHGKPPFMSPEQCRNDIIDARSDIYALGVLFYTLVNGSPPFMSGNPLEIMKMHESSPAPELPESIPASVRNIIKKMLEKKPDDRYRSVDEILIEIDKIAESNMIFDSGISKTVYLDMQQERYDEKEKYAEEEIKSSAPKRYNYRLKLVVIGIILYVVLLTILAYFIIDKPEPPIVIPPPPGIIEFPPTTVNAESNEIYTVENNINRPIYINNIKFVGRNAETFMSDINVPVLVEPGSLLSIPIAFNPTTIGDFSAYMILDVYDGELQSYEIPLYGKSVTELIPGFKASAPRFPSVKAGDRARDVVRIENTGNKGYNINSIEVTGSHPESFIIETQFPLAIPPNADQEIQLIFQPESDGNKSATIVFHTSDSQIGSPGLDISGAVLRVAEPNITGDTEIKFPQTRIPYESNTGYVVRNTGSGQLIINSIKINGSNDSEFTIIEDYPLRIPPNNEKVLDVTFAPLTHGEKSASLLIESNDPNNKLLSVSLSGNALPSLDIPTANLDQYFVEANDLFDRQRYREAESIYTSIIEHDPLYASAFYMRGRTLFEIGQYRRAVGDFDELHRVIMRIPALSRKRVDCDRLYYASLAVTQEWLQSMDESQQQRLKTEAERRWDDFRYACKHNQEQIGNAKYWLEELNKD